jgi:peptidylprolyl isomerase
MKTTLGDIKVRLYDETPIHRDNFIKLVQSRIYDGVSFHRVIKDFMIQTGDPATNTSLAKSQTDTLILKTIPAEFRINLFHKKGALAAARQANEVNPEMRSSAFQFYIVQGIKYTDDELNQAEILINNNIKQAEFLKLIKAMTDSSRISGLNLSLAEIQEKSTIRMYEHMENSVNFRLSEEQRTVYKNIGGTPRLDGTYTVFGEVIEGLEVVDRIASVKTNNSNRPLNDIRIIKMRLVKK